VCPAWQQQLGGTQQGPGGGGCPSALAPPIQPHLQHNLIYSTISLTRHLVYHLSYNKPTLLGLHCHKNHAAVGVIVGVGCSTLLPCHAPFIFYLFSSPPPSRQVQQSVRGQVQPLLLTHHVPLGS
jgi:hypothetical protein